MAGLKRKLDRGALQTLAEARIRDVQVLLDSARYDAAFYLAGYAVECGLKACIAKSVQQYDFPDKDTVNASYSHGLDGLLGVTGLAGELDASMKVDGVLARYWAFVRHWEPECRYDAGVSQIEARDFYQAISDPDHGVLQWVRQHW